MGSMKSSNIKKSAFEKAKFGDLKEWVIRRGNRYMVLKLTKKQYTDLYGATKGDKIRLGDTDILIEIEKDLISHGDECVFGGGKTLRDGLAQTSGVTNCKRCLRLRHHKCSCT